jgi:hypothetical protein
MVPSPNPIEAVFYHIRAFLSMLLTSEIIKVVKAILGKPSSKDTLFRIARGEE